MPGNMFHLAVVLGYDMIPLYIISSVDIRAQHMYVIYIPTAGSEVNGFDQERQQSCFRKSSEGAKRAIRKQERAS